MTRPAPQSISPFFLDRALPEGGGANVVNVMLVDFRGFDTLGEISVLAIVGLTVYALLRRFRPPQEVDQLPPQQRLVPADLVIDLNDPRRATDAGAAYLIIPAVFARLLLPVSGLIALFLFLRGHNEPGGGFVAGLVVAIGFITQYMVAGARWVEAHLRLPVLRWAGVGLLLAIATGLGAVVLGYPFLTSHTAHLDLPLIGPIHLASAMFFDLGVFAVVVGSTLLILTALAHQSIRGHRPRHKAQARQAPRNDS
ncbi:MAG: monovalent cation/H+ antiporter subunit A, partial [Burkholderiaceae bacterium]|jgi:multicomponent K+:H+ antiporter subunit A|nr:monovalent cation/H+ antiporter subunit A [Burkholderiaceae bacterium]